MPRDLTNDEALAEAVRRWGKNGAVRREPPLTPARFERRKAEILAEERKKDEKWAATNLYASAPRCEYTNARGGRCTKRAGHDPGVALGTADYPHTSRLSGEQRAELWIALLEKKRGGVATVGKIMLGMFFEVRAEAPTFREAFAEVDRKEAAEHAAYEAQRDATKKRSEAAKAAHRARKAKEEMRQARVAIVARAMLADPGVIARFGIPYAACARCSASVKAVLGGAGGDKLVLADHPAGGSPCTGAQLSLSDNRELREQRARQEAVQ